MISLSLTWISWMIWVSSSRMILQWNDVRFLESEEVDEDDWRPKHFPIFIFIFSQLLEDGDDQEAIINSNKLQFPPFMSDDCDFWNSDSPSSGWNLRRRNGSKENESLSPNPESRRRRCYEWKWWGVMKRRVELISLGGMDAAEDEDDCNLGSNRSRLATDWREDGWSGEIHDAVEGSKGVTRRCWSGLRSRQRMRVTLMNWIQDPEDEDFHSMIFRMMSVSLVIKNPSFLLL